MTFGAAIAYKSSGADSSEGHDGCVTERAITLPGNPISREESERALPLTLRGGPASVEAQAWVASIVDTIIIPAVGISDRPSSRRKALAAAGALLGDLFDLQSGRKSGGGPLCGSHAMSPKAFAGKDRGFGFDIFQPVIKALEAAGLLVVARGLPRWQTWQGQDGTDVVSTKGRVTRFRLTPAALDSAAACGVEVADWQRHWGPTAPVVVQVKADVPRLVLHGLKVRQGRRKLAAPVLPIDQDHPQVIRHLRDLEDLNGYMGRQAVSGFPFSGVRRIFNNGDQPGFAWRWGGRYASLPGGLAYENMSAERRLERIKLNGSTVAEVDIRACHLTLLYALSGHDAGPGDPYDVPGLPRVVVKSWVGQAIGGGKATFSRWSAEAKGRYEAACPGRSLGDDFKPAAVAIAVLKSHPILGRLQELGWGSVSLMYQEAEVLTTAMRLLRLQDVAALPIHDGLIVAEGDVEAAKAAMSKAFADQVRQEVGTEPRCLPAFKVDKGGRRVKLMMNDHHRGTYRGGQEPGYTGRKSHYLVL